MLITNQKINKNVYISVLILILAFNYTKFNVSASPQAIILEVELISKINDIPVNSSHFFNNYSFSLISHKHNIFIASVSGKLSFLPSFTNNISLIPQNHPPSIGLEPLSPIYLQFSSSNINVKLANENVATILNINFQLFLDSYENFGKIVTKTAIFNETTSKVELIAPVGAVWYSISFSDDATSTFGFFTSIILISVLFGIHRLFKRRS